MCRGGKRRNVRRWDLLLLDQPPLLCCSPIGAPSQLEEPHLQTLTNGQEGWGQPGIRGQVVPEGRSPQWEKFLCILQEIPYVILLSYLRNTICVLRNKCNSFLYSTIKILKSPGHHIKQYIYVTVLKSQNDGKIIQIGINHEQIIWQLPQ